MAATVDEYLQLTDIEARGQWKSIAGRVPLARQADFLPVETLLCYGLFYLLDPHRFGGGNIAQVPPQVTALAVALKRTPGSITNKMLNLDGSRRNAARPEPELFIRLQESGRYEPLYRRVLKAARLEGFAESQVPDFLAALDDDDQVAMFGQEELGSPEAAMALYDMLEHQLQLGLAHGFTETETSRQVEQRVRLAQHRFAAAVLANFRWTCGFCGFAPGQLRGYGLLIASHVKPWARSTNRERGDVANGICACPTHDSAFDAGLLTVAPDLQIRKAMVLETQMQVNGSLHGAFGERAMRSSLLVPAGAAKPRDQFLAFHASEVFRG